MIDPTIWIYEDLYLLMNKWYLHVFWFICRDGSRTATKSKMECFVIIVNSFQPLTIIAKHSILDVAAVLAPLLIWLLENHLKSFAAASGKNTIKSKSYSCSLEMIRSISLKSSDRYKIFPKSKLTRRLGHKQFLS